MNIAILADKQTAVSEAPKLVTAFEKGEHQAEILRVDQPLMAALQAKRPDICCIAAGTQGCAGMLQEMLEFMQIPFLGSGSQACRLSADEQLSLFSLRRYAEASEEESTLESLVSFSVSSEFLSVNKEALIEVCEERIPGGCPFEVLQSSEGGMVGIACKTAETCEANKANKVDEENGFCKVANREEFEAALEAYAQTGCVVRQWVEGVRLSVSVLGTGWDAHVLPPIDTKTMAPVKLDSLSGDEQVAHAIRSEIERCAFEICLALGMRDFALVNLIWDGAQVRLSGIEAVPSMKETSSFAAACKAAGLSVGGVLNHLVSL